MINKVTLIGNLGADPEIRYTTDGTAVANFSVATTDTWKDKNGEKQQSTEWHKIVCFNRLAEIAQEFLHKGKQVYIEGKIQYRTWDKDDGTKGYATEIKAHIVKFLGGGGGKSKADYQAEAYGGVTEDDDIPF